MGCWNIQPAANSQRLHHHVTYESQNDLSARYVRAFQAGFKQHCEKYEEKKTAEAKTKQISG